MKQVTGGVCAAQGFSAAGIHCGIKDNFTMSILKHDAMHS